MARSFPLKGDMYIVHMYTGFWRKPGWRPIGPVKKKKEQMRVQKHPDSARPGSEDERWIYSTVEIQKKKRVHTPEYARNQSIRDSSRSTRYLWWRYSYVHCRSLLTVLKMRSFSRRKGGTSSAAQSEPLQTQSLSSATTVVGQQDEILQVLPDEA